MLYWQYNNWCIELLFGLLFLIKFWYQVCVKKHNFCSTCAEMCGVAVIFGELWYLVASTLKGDNLVSKLPWTRWRNNDQNWMKENSQTNNCAFPTLLVRVVYHLFVKLTLYLMLNYFGRLKTWWFVADLIVVVCLPVLHPWACRTLTRLFCAFLMSKHKFVYLILSQNVERPIGPVCLQNKHAWIAEVGKEELLNQHHGNITVAEIGDGPFGQTSPFSSSVEHVSTFDLCIISILHDSKLNCRYSFVWKMLSCIDLITRPLQ